MSLSARQSKEKSPYLPRKARIEETFPVTGKEMFFRITPSARIKYAPGQFLMAGLPGCGEAPFSISSASGEKTVELCVRAVGNVTRALHGLKKGDTIWIRGPFGKGFDVDKMKGKDLLFIAGGIGLVPMRSLIKTVLSKRNLFGRLTLLYGVKEPSELLFKEEIKIWEGLGMDVKITIDRFHPGWKGNVGVVTTLIGPCEVDEAKTAAVIIGPPVMYKYVILALGSKKLRGEDMFLSLERRMKCGLGKCGHCQIQSVYVCQEGPVFKFSEIRHLKEAI